MPVPAGRAVTPGAPAGTRAQARLVKCGCGRCRPSTRCQSAVTALVIQRLPPVTVTESPVSSRRVPRLTRSEPAVAASVAASETTASPASAASYASRTTGLSSAEDSTGTAVATWTQAASTTPVGYRESSSVSRSRSGPGRGRTPSRSALVGSGYSSASTPARPSARQTSRAVDSGLPLATTPSRASRIDAAPAGEPATPGPLRTAGSDKAHLRVEQRQ